MHRVFSDTLAEERAKVQTMNGTANQSMTAEDGAHGGTVAAPTSPLLAVVATSVLSLPQEAPPEHPELMDGFESPNDCAIEDNCCEDTGTIHLESEFEEKTLEIDECRGLDELGGTEDHMVEPKIGMTFDTAEQAYNYYNRYARMIGFSVRKQRTNRNRADRSKIHRQGLVCACEGTYRKIRTPRKRREARRFECKAMFEFKLIGDKYSVIKFIPEHSHNLVPTQCSHCLRSQRKIEFSQVGGAQHLNFNRSDCNNLIQRTQAEFFKRGDSQCLLDYFKQKKWENKHFFYSFRTNEECEIRGVFFCDAKSRRDYGLFGDAIYFDTTFRINNYRMLCILIVGINNHGQTTLFGCGLLDGETTDAVLWLFTNFLEAMGGKKPISIFTDQSIVISNAISTVFPESHHGLCLWHIYQNAAKHLAKVFAEFKSFAPRFKACIYDAETIEEFEQSWDELLEDNGLRDIEWLQGLYELRKKWAQVYSRVHFCAGMTTTQTSESINKFLKEYFGCSIVLREFVDQYSKAMANRREKEREAEKETQQTSPILISGWSVEREASEKYTKKMFNCFQEEYQKTIDLLLELEKDDGTIRTYRAIEIEGRKKNHTVTYNHLEQSMSCTCRKFEFSGILCSHALRLFHDLQYTSLPPKYYLKRWTRAIVDEGVFDPYGDLIPNDIDPSFTARYTELSRISQRIVAKGSKLKEVFSLTKLAMLELEAKVEAMTISKEDRSPAVHKSTSETQSSLISDLNEEAPLRDPTMRCSPGKPKKRMKSSLETTVRKKTSSKARGGKAENLAVTHIMTGASSIRQPMPVITQRDIYPKGIHPQGIYPPYIFVGSQEQRPSFPNQLFMSQQASSSQTHAHQEIRRNIDF